MFFSTKRVPKEGKGIKTESHVISAPHSVRSVITWHRFSFPPYPCTLVRTP